MDIVSPQLEAYIDELLPADDDILKEMEREARKRQFPIVGPQVGRLLRQLAMLTGALRVFEMGSGFGYSAYWFLKGMPVEGRIVLTDDSQDNLDKARSYLGRGGFMSRATFEHGDALELVERYPGPFDVIFNDIDKDRYPEAFRKALPRLRPGGLLISDNVLWFGSVVSDSLEPDVQGIRDYNRLISKGEEVFSAIIPIRDGLSVSVKV